MLTFDTEIRTHTGTGASRRLRRRNELPAVVYGGGQPPIAIALSRDKVNNAENKEEFYSHPWTLRIGGVETKVKLQAVQRHPVQAQLIHLDFLRTT